MSVLRLRFTVCPAHKAVVILEFEGEWMYNGLLVQQIKTPALMNIDEFSKVFFHGFDVRLMPDQLRVLINGKRWAFRCREAWEVSIENDVRTPIRVMAQLLPKDQRQFVDSDPVIVSSSRSSRVHRGSTRGPNPENGVVH